MPGMRYQPQGGGARLNKAHPLARQLTFAWVASGPDINLVTGKPATWRGTEPERAAYPNGLRRKFVGGASLDFGFGSDVNFAGLSNQTVFAEVLIQNASTDGYICGRVSLSWDYHIHISAGTQQISYSCGGASTGLRVPSTSIVGGLDPYVGRTLPICGTYDKVTSKLYIDGALKNSQSQTSSFSTSTSDGFAIGSRGGGGQSGASGVSVGLVLIFKRTLSDSEVLSLSTNPWQLFQQFEEDDFDKSIILSSYTGSGSGSSLSNGITASLATSIGSSSINGLRGFIAKSNGTSSAIAIKGILASSYGSSVSSSISGQIAQSSGSSIASASSGGIGISNGYGTAISLSLGGSIGSMTGSSNVQAFTVSLGFSNGSSNVVGYSSAASAGLSYGYGDAIARSGNVGIASGFGTASGNLGYFGISQCSSHVQANSLPLFLAQSYGVSESIGICGSVGVSISGASIGAVILPMGLRPIESSYSILSIDYLYAETSIDSVYNLINIESDYYGDPA